MLRIVIAAIALLWPTIGWSETIYPGYEWHPLGNDIYVHTQENPFAGPVDGNSIIIINEDDVVVVDTHINPAVARAVVAKIQSLTDNPVSTVVNTHWHDDHVNGNDAFQRAFPDAEFIAHPFSAEKLKTEWRELEESRMAAFEGMTLERLNELAEAAEEADDPLRAMNIRLYAGYFEALRSELPDMKYVQPTTTVSKELVIERGDRKIDIQWIGVANTEGDLVVSLPNEKILMTGDMLVAPIPYAFDSPMQKWPLTLATLKEFGAETIIPGHGKPQSDTQYIDQLIDLLNEMMAQVEQAAQNGVAYEDLAAAIDLDEHRALFTGDATDAEFAWKNYFLDPGMKSAWVSLGYPLPTEEE